MVNARKNKMWAVTSYFNTQKSPILYRNFQQFRRRLSVPLLVVEFAQEQKFELNTQDADRLIQLSDGDVMWQKERLFNLALNHLPDHCDIVVWLDSDIIFYEENWVHLARQALKKYCIIQLFSHVYDLAKNASPSSIPKTDFRESLVRKLQKREINFDVFRVCGQSLILKYSPGHAWAIRRDIIEKHKFYDTCVLGGGDKAIASAAYGQIQAVPEAMFFSTEHKEHYTQWANPFYESIRDNGNIGYIEGTILHLWHGNLQKRGYENRYQHFQKYNFDPRYDIQLSNENLWSWNTKKTKMHSYVENYFQQRNSNT